MFQESVYILISHCIFFLSWQHTKSSLWLNSYFKTLEYITIIWSNPGCKQEPFRGHVLHRDKTVSKYATPHNMFLSSIIYVVHIKIKNWNVRSQEAKDPPHALILLCHTWDRRPLLAPNILSISVQADIMAIRCKSFFLFNHFAGVVRLQRMVSNSCNICLLFRYVLLSQI